MKVDGHLGSLVQGVSQQTPTERRKGQHTEQINMLADPVRGLSRRHGTIWQTERDLQLESAKLDENLADVASFRSFDYTSQGRDFCVLYRSATKASGADMPVVVVYDKTNREFLPLTRNVSDTLLDSLESGGVSAITAVGKYVFFAGHTIVPVCTNTDAWGDTDNQKQTVLWVRGGAYSRTYKATVTKTDNSQVSFEYTTPTSSYPGTLDTSSVPPFIYAGVGPVAYSETAYLPLDTAVANLITYRLYYGGFGTLGLTVSRNGSGLTNVYPASPATNTEFSWDVSNRDVVIFHDSNADTANLLIAYTSSATAANPSYTATVTNITTAYNSAVTRWIGDAAEAIQPENIAESLKGAATAAGLTGVTRESATVVFTDVKDITFSDSGDGSLLKGLANTCATVSDLTDAHYVGKIVKVSPTGDEAFYMRAEAKNAIISSGVTEVKWVEAAGVDRVITATLVYGVADGANFYIAGSATLLNAILAGDHPDYAPAHVGDDDSSPAPHFAGRTISYLGVFQDRLLIGSDAVIRASKTGDYLNFFRESVLTVRADDSFEMLSQGTEDDTIRFSVLYDRDLILFGKRQYAISGRTTLSPTNANMPVMSSHNGANEAQPVAAGGLIFYAKQGQSATSVHQIEPGRNAESPESFPASSQLDKYMLGRPVELTVVAKPSTLLARTSGSPNSLCVFSYLDTNERRVQDCWHRWNYAAEMGPLLGLTTVDEGAVVFTFRSGNDEGGTPRQWAVADLQPLDAELSELPYLDSMRSHEDVLADTNAAHHMDNADLSAAFDDSSTAFLLGVSDLDDVEALLEDLPEATGLQLGYQYEALWSPTNPLVRGPDEAVITQGRLTVTALQLAFRDSSGFRSVVTAYGSDSEYRFNGRVVGDVNNILGQVPVTEGTRSIPIGRESREYVQSIYALTWLPLNITAVGWSGQFFHRPQRVS